MNPARLAAIEAAAHDLAGRIEWIDVDRSPGDMSPTGFRAAFDIALADPDFAEEVHSVLTNLFAWLRRNPAAWEMIGHQEVELEAVGMLQAAVKKALQSCGPDEQSLLRDKMLTIKFHGIRAAFTQARPGQWVPSIADQVDHQTKHGN